MANQYTAFTYVTDTEKECRDCKEIKPHAEFSKDRKNIRHKGLAYYCKACASRRTREHHRKRIAAGDEEYKQAKRDAYFKTKYNISLTEREEMLRGQAHKCAICKVALSESGYGTHTDHCHETGKIRAILCTNCNRGLGHFQDNAKLLRAAAMYLDIHKGEVENGRLGSN